ncbi:MAG: hypothetical protein HZB26_16885 [Candidatus Hydrogenedentes bacterium]|nr:hypothetical protein [Candidatus Hydrogenedentota bacterium]
MNNVLEQLCDTLEEELERQENVLAVCYAQNQAVRAHHLDSLNAKTLALELLIRDAVRAQGARTALFRRVVEEYNVPAARQTMSGLIAIVPEPWSTRLGAFQNRMRAVLAEIRTALHDNAISLRSSGRALDDLLERFDGAQASRAGSYTAQGLGPVRSGREPAILNQIG